MKSWGMLLLFLSLVISLTFSVEHHNRIYIGLTLLILLLNLETHVTMNASMMLLFLITSLMCLPLLRLIKSVFGTVKIDNSYSEFKCQDWTVIALPLCMMESLLFQDGQMVKLELFFLNQENYCMSSTMLITMVAQQLQPHPMAKG